MNSPIRVGIVDAGAIVRLSHLPAMHRVDGIRPVAIADSDAERAGLLAKECDFIAYACSSWPKGLHPTPRASAKSAGGALTRDDGPACRE